MDLRLNGYVHVIETLGVSGSSYPMVDYREAEDKTKTTHALSRKSITN
jgi:hypothetical protein